MMRRPRASFLLRRMGAARLLMASMLLAILIAAALAATLAAFSALALPQAARSQLIAADRSASITISGQTDAGQTATDTAAIRSLMRAVFGPVPVRLSQALWSDSLGLPAADGASTTIPLAQAATFDRLNANAVLVTGSWPGPPQPGQPIQAALPAAVESRLHLAPGKVLALTDRDTGARVRIVLTGLFRPRDPSSPYWGLDPLGRSGVSVRGNFVTYGPLIVAPAAFGRSWLPVGAASWLVQPTLARVQPDSITGLTARIRQAQTRLTQAESLGGLTVSTTIPQLLRGIGSNLVVARSLLMISVLQLMLLTAVAISLAARMLAGQREEESALLSARGVTRWQLVRLTLAEAVALAGAAAAAGTLAGAWLAGPLSRIGPLRTARLHMSGWPASIWWTAAAILVICTVVMLWPAARPMSPGSARARRSRQARLADAAQAGADIAVIALGALAVWQLRDYSAVGRSAAGHTGIDPVLVAAPTLALAGAALIPLRLLPVLASVADRLAARTRRLAGALASWEVSRRPIRQSGPVLLVILAAAAGTLALAQHATWRQAAQDQADFAVGSDARVNLTTPVPLSRVAAIQHAPGTTGAMAVASFNGGLSGQVLAIDTRQAASVVLMRPDESALPLAALWKKIAPAQARPGLQLPGRPARLELAASVRPLSGGLALAPLSVTFSIQDAAGIVYSVSAGRLPADGRGHDLIARLSAARQASYPLRLLGMALSFQLPSLPPIPALPLATPAANQRALQAVRRAAARRATLTIEGLAVAPSAAGPFGGYFATASTLRAWHPAALSSDLTNPLAHGTRPVITAWQPASGSGRSLVFGPGGGYLIQREGAPPLPISGELTLTAGLPGRPIPVIATRAFLSSARTAVGSTVFVAAGGVSIPAKIVATVRNFPTAGPGGLLIVDQSAIQQALASRSAAPLPVNQWWLRTAPGPASAASPPITGLPGGASVFDRARTVAALLGNPLSAAPQQAVLVIAVAAALLAVLGISVSVAASVRERRMQSALLSALGVSKAAQASQLCLEELLLSAPAAVAGLVLGAGVAHLLVPAVTLTVNATAPVPPALIELPLGSIAGLAAVITAIPVLVAAATVARRTDPAAQLRAAEAV